MKTAMQELIEWLDIAIEELKGNDSTDFAEGLVAARVKANKALEKEKEQIIKAHNNSVISPYTELYVHKIQGKSPITKGEEYYNKRYNQNN
jgi:hypothetical protein